MKGALLFLSLFFVIFDIGHFRFFLRLAINCRKYKHLNVYLLLLDKVISRNSQSLLPEKLYEMAIVISYNNLDFGMQNTQYNTWLININF